MRQVRESVSTPFLSVLLTGVVQLWPLSLFLALVAIVAFVELEGSDGVRNL